MSFDAPNKHNLQKFGYFCRICIEIFIILWYRFWYSLCPPFGVLLTLVLICLSFLAVKSGGSSTRADKRPRTRVSSRPCNPSQDQVGGFIFLLCNKHVTVCYSNIFCFQLGVKDVNFLSIYWSKEIEPGNLSASELLFDPKSTDLCKLLITMNGLIVKSLCFYTFLVCYV